MFKLPERFPNSYSTPQEWADYAEFLALKSKKISLLGVIKPSSLISDEIEIEGIEDESDKFISKAEEISREIENRISLMGSKYPFTLSQKGYVLEFSPKHNPGTLVYTYLLFATRAKMTGKSGENGIFNEIDGTLIFEKLCSEIIQNFFGEGTNVEVFGTSSSDGSSFREKLEGMVKRLGEGRGIKSHLNSKTKDDKLDIVVWKSFKDEKTSRFIGFGQCKTGTSWMEKLTELNPRFFCETWLENFPVIEPIRIFFTAQYFPIEQWEQKVRQAGLIFDRFRIIEFLPDQLSSQNESDIRLWLEGATSRYIDLEENAA